MNAITFNLKRCPAAGTGVHYWAYGAAHHCRRVGVPPDEAERLIAAGMTRAPQPGEIQSAVRSAYGSPAHTGRRHHPNTAPPTPKWLAVNQEQRQAIVASGIGLADLWEMSPIRLDPDTRHTEWAIDQLFPGDPLLCVGASMSRFTTQPREQLRGSLSGLALIVPSPMRARRGKVKDGTRESAHTLDNTGPRRFLICEFDWGTRDEQAGLLLHLSQRAPMAMALTSGGKSLHGWFAVHDRTDDDVLRFFRYAVSIGADRACWTRSQFVRMPDGTRDSGARQTVYFFNPEALR